MARDRDRARRRRAERRSGGGDDAVDPRSGDDAVDLPRDDAVDSPLGEGTAAPDPLDHASAEVDEALLAEAGAVHPDADGATGEIYEDELGDDRERADDAVQGDAVSRHEIAREAGGPRRKRGRFITFLGHSVDELRRVQWPNRRQVGQATAVVLGFVVIAGGYLGLLDALMQPLIEAIL
jgi:preprotein translocase SecE subunit